MAVLVYRYGIRTRTEEGRFELPEEVKEQLRLVRRMRNGLIEIELGHDEAMKILWSSDQRISDVERAIEEEEAALLPLIAQAKAERSTDRTVATRKETAKKVKDLRKKVKALRQHRRVIQGEIRAELKPGIEALKEQRKADIKTLRQEYAAAGLYWASYNMVIADGQVANKLVAAARAKGQAAAMHYRRFDGSGTIAVQLQSHPGLPRRSPELIASGEGPWKNVLQIHPWMDPEEFNANSKARRRRHGRGWVHFSIGAGRQVRLPVQVHRMMPADADICEATLTVRNIASKQTMELCITVKVSDPEPVQGRPPVALHLGWRSRTSGGTRVATWACTEPLDIPEAMSSFIVGYDGGRWGEIVLPARMDAASRPAALRSQRDLSMAPILEAVAEWLDSNPQPDTDERPGLKGSDVRRWRSAGRLAALTLRWRNDPPRGSSPILERMEAWRKQDKHLWEWEANERHQLLGFRDDAWRNVSAWLGDRAGIVVTDDANLATLRQKEDIADDDPVLPGSALAKARARATLAAPGRLRQLVHGAATRRGVTVCIVPTAHLTRTHRTCGFVADANPQYAQSTTVTCPGCGKTYDQDHNAALLMLDRERSSGNTVTL